MWADNETEVDLLGFEYLVDELEILLTEKRLLPVTVGVAGDWGSGKSSLMHMTEARLSAAGDEIVCVQFSPWRFEDYHDIKTALMLAVVDAIGNRVENGSEGLKTRAKGLVQRARKRLHEFGLLRHAAQIGTAAAGGGPEEMAAAGAAADAVTAGAAPTEEEQRRSFESVAEFHEEFAQLMESLGDDVQSLVVFIDDMDRCSTQTIVETFEAIRLFLLVEKTAYVIGAHTDIVTAALDDLYPARRDGDADLGLNYMEKMLQNMVVIPPLSEPQTLTYINLLFAELYTDEEAFQEVKVVVQKNYAADVDIVAFNDAIAREALEDVPAELTSALEIAGRIGPSLSRGLRGNPRQIKRFLNKFMLRQRTASKRAMGLEPDKLAKLMVLEELHPSDFERVFHWQIASEGVPDQIRVAEALAREEKVDDPPEDIADWLLQPGIRGWLQTEPSLAGTVLGPYFTFSRDRFRHSLVAAMLPVELQRLLVKLRSETEPVRHGAVATASKLPPGQLAELIPALQEAGQRDLNGPAAKAWVELAAEVGAVADSLFAVLDETPEGKVPGNFVLKMQLHFKDDPRLPPLLARWGEKGSSGAKRQAKRASEKSRKSGS